MRYISVSAMLTLIFLLSTCSGGKDILPAEWHGLKLKKRLTGAEAKAFVDKLHHKSVTPEENEIGFYEGENGPAIVYVTHYSDSGTAEAESRRMTEKISPKNSVFIGGEYLERGGKQVYRCFGMGQTHFVFSHGADLFWLSVNTMSAAEHLDAYLDYLK